MQMWAGWNLLLCRELEGIRGGKGLTGGERLVAGDLESSLVAERLLRVRKPGSRRSGRGSIPTRSRISCPHFGTGFRDAQARVLSGSADCPETYPFRDLGGFDAEVAENTALRERLITSDYPT